MRADSFKFFLYYPSVNKKKGSIKDMKLEECIETVKSIVIAVSVCWLLILFSINRILQLNRDFFFFLNMRICKIKSQKRKEKNNDSGSSTVPKSLFFSKLHFFSPN